VCRLNRFSGPACTVAVGFVAAVGVSGVQKAWLWYPVLGRRPGMRIRSCHSDFSSCLSLEILHNLLARLCVQILFFLLWEISLVVWFSLSSGLSHWFEN